MGYHGDEMTSGLNSQGRFSQIGFAAKESVRQQFLMPRLALDHLQAVKGQLEDIGQLTGEVATLHPQFA